MCMVIGHNFTFSCQEDASHFMKFLRKEGISARIEPVPQTTYSFVLKGRYDNLYRYFTACKEKLNRENIESDTETDEFFSPEDKKILIEEVNSLFDTLEKQKEQAIRNLEGKSAGDIAFEPKFSDSEQNEEEIRAYMQFLYENKILMDNGIFDFTDNVLHYKELKPVDEFEYRYEISPGLYPDDDQLDTFDITRIKNINAEMDYTVRAGPEIIGVLELDKLKEELESMEEEEGYIIHAIHSLILKREMADYILSVMDSSGAETIEELIEEIEMCPGQCDTNERSITSYDISPDFVTEVIEDLKKLDFVRMKGNKIKMNRK